MLSGLTYKKKNGLLLICTVLVLIMVYSLAIKRTFAIYELSEASEEKIEQAKDAPLMIMKLKKELQEMDQRIGKNKNQINNEQQLLELVTGYCQSNHSILREFPKGTLAEKGNLLIETNHFTVQGSFSMLLKLVYELEQKEALGKVASVRYQLKKDIQTKELALTVSVYIQNVKKKTNEE